MSSGNNNNSGGVGFFGLLTIVFVTLKLTDYIDWSWWLVLLPLYGSVSISVIILIALAIIADKR